MSSIIIRILELKLEDFRIPFEEIKSGTANFSAENHIGDGGFGKVYKGKLSNSRGKGMVAIKRLNPEGLQGKSEFRNEVSMLYSYKHKNIVNFIGYCDEGDQKIIVYEYAVNGSLDKHLRDRNKMKRLSWEQRLKICIGAAEGLLYLHSGIGVDLRVIHRDVKSSNILLNENLEAMISDFGLAKFGPRNQPYTQLNTRVAGTDGYCDPHYYATNTLTKESDVYSFGVILFELLCGRLVFPKNNCSEDNHDSQNLVALVHHYYKDGLDKIIDPQISSQIKNESLHAFKEIAYQCLEMDYKKRPKMVDVFNQLKQALNTQLDGPNRTKKSRKTRTKKNRKTRLGVGIFEPSCPERGGVLDTLDGPSGSKDVKARMESQLPCVLVLSGKSAKEKELAESLKGKASLKLADNVEILTFLHPDTERPSEKDDFDIDSYMGALSTSCFGRFLLWSPRLSSTQDMVSFNFGELPVGSVCVADVQYKGRGYFNKWESPKGSLLFSFTIKMENGHLVPFLQYVLSLAVTEAIKDLACKNGIRTLDVRIKWPNDIYLHGLKVGGILCTSNYRSKKFEVSAGVGLNVDNEKPTTFLNAARREDIISAFFNKFENLFHLFITEGFQPLEELYYNAWLHSGQRVIVQEKSEDEDLLVENVVTVQGLTSSGYLLAIGDDGQKCELHPNGNSFDFSEGLVKRKLEKDQVTNP